MSSAQLVRAAARAGVAIAAMVAFAPACRKDPTPPVPVPAPVLAPAPTANSTPPAQLPEAPSPVQAPPPDLGVPHDAFIAARTLQLCAHKYHQDEIAAETLAVNRLLGHDHPIDLDRVFDPAPKAKGKVLPPPDTGEQLAMRTKLRSAVGLAQAHTATQEAIASAVAGCAYAPEVGLVQDALVDKYIETFVAVACLQRKHTGHDGQFDATAHAQAAGEVFRRTGMTAGEMSRYGIIMGRFPHLQARIHVAKSKACPDPRVAAEELRVTGQWSGQLTGDRTAALNLNGVGGGRIKGAVQWQGATVKWADGSAEAQALPVEGQLSGDRISLFGQVGGDWVRIEGKSRGGDLAGTWSARRADGAAFKGSFAAARVGVPAAPTPGAATATAP